MTIAKTAGASVADVYKLAKYNPISANAHENAQGLKELSGKRRLREYAAQWACEKDLDVNTVKRDLAMIDNLTGNLRYENVTDVLYGFVKDAAAGPPDNPLRLPFEAMNGTIGGIFPGSMVTIAGRTSSGKSSFALQTAKHLALGGCKTVYVSLEMSPRQLSARLLAAETGLRQKDLLRREITDWDKINDAIDIYVKDGGNLLFSTLSRDTI